MAMRWGLGPVFAYEWLTGARRWQQYALRSGFVALLLGGMTIVWWNLVAKQIIRTHHDLAQVGEAFYAALIGIQLTLLLMVAPAATAGAICLDRSRGTLAHMLMTDLSNAEIVLGKLAARLVPVLGLVACTLPVAALGTLLGGIDPDALFGAFLVSIGIAVLGCALALTLSVWAGKTHEVILLTYLILGIWLLAGPAWRLLSWTTRLVAGPPPDWLMRINPFWLAFAPFERVGLVTWSDYWFFLAGAVVISIALTILAVARVRSVALREGVRKTKRARWRWMRLPAFPRRWWAWLPGPSLDRNPVLWREWHRRRPSKWGRAIQGLYLLLALVFSGLASYEAWVGSGPQRTILGAFVNAFQVAIGMLMVCVAATTALAEERIRGSLDVLLATPLSTSTIVLGKWLGAFRSVPLLAVLPTLVILMAALGGSHGTYPLAMVGLVLAYGMAVTSLGLALGTWIARLGRAIAVGITIYLLITVGWMFFMMEVVRTRIDQQGWLRWLLYGGIVVGALMALGAVVRFLRGRGPIVLTAALALIVLVAGSLACFVMVAAWDRSNNFDASAGLAMVSPWYGPGMLTAAITEGRNEPFDVWALGWIVLHAQAALVLLLLTIATFDRCLSRMPEQPPRWAVASRSRQPIAKPRPVVESGSFL